MPSPVREGLALAGTPLPPAASVVATVIPPEGARAATGRLSWRSGPGSSRTCSNGRGSTSSSPAFWVRAMRPKRITTAWLSDEMMRKLLPIHSTPSSRVTM